MKFFLNFLKRKQGSVAIEFALVVPILIILTAGIYDLSQLMLLHQRLDRFAAFIGTATSFKNPALSNSSATIDSIDNIQAIISQLNKPYDLDMTKGTVIISHIANTAQSQSNADMLITWQMVNNSIYTSKLGKNSSKPTNIPNGFTLVSDQEMIAVEVFYTYSPLFQADFLSNIYNIYKIILVPIKGSSMSYLYGN